MASFLEDVISGHENAMYGETGTSGLYHNSPTQTNYNINATSDLANRISQGVGSIPMAGPYLGGMTDLAMPALALGASPFYDTSQAIGKAKEKYGSSYGMVDDTEIPGGPTMGQLGTELNNQNILSSMFERSLGAATPLASKLSFNTPNFDFMGSAQASELTDLERDFPGMSTGDIIDSMNNRGPVATNIETAPQPKEAIYQDRIMNNNLPSYGYEPKQGILQGLQNKIGGLKDFLPFGDKSLSGMAVKGIKSLFERNPNAPSYQTYDPTGKIDYSQLNTTNLNDFYDSNEDSETFGTTRFDRAAPGSFGSFRTLADYFNRNKNAAAALTTKKAKKEAAMQQQIKDAQARQAVLDARQAAADRSRQSYNPGNIGGGSYRSDRDNSRDGGYGGSSKRSADNRSSDLGFSDIRLKDNIELVGKSPSDINIYNFTYLNDPKVYQGVMAQEVPWASVKHDSGYLMVDYSKVDVEFKRKDTVASMFTRRR